VSIHRHPERSGSVAFCASCDALTDLDAGACVTCETILDREAAWAAADAWTLPDHHDPMTETPDMAVFYRRNFA